MSDAYSQLGIDAEEALELASDLRVQSSITIVAISVLFYDTILTFPQELRCIWLRKWSGATVLYLGIRYFILLHLVMSCILDHMIPSGPQGYVINVKFFGSVRTKYRSCSCKVGYNISNMSIVVAFTAVPVFQCFRVWAISGRSYILAAIVLALSMVAPCIDIYADSLPSSFVVVDSGPLSGCWRTEGIPTFP
ncbi:hypothetical protein K474DRAFT_1164111 [Panus rudis PR-1116 ss-1]|nr:hypothetical protein K474DRAFT_1164111 [Panus rudis PR-1116 ss-1]